ncbi:3-hydroxyacyl-CoA dehydrogenase [Subtercola sp. Z020]|uniref:Rv3235 family protein n=1 Tax=Subtercola sp. Z020 TaxID=2080582 RepID=UPI000CE907AE|nr:Rv3235 family protein [Subtercola sp. Z020]PPF87869.1 3-hydroxyacyl-CoA dehydrogenase [Subtercola sp. Z020]
MSLSPTLVDLDRPSPGLPSHSEPRQVDAPRPLGGPDQPTGKEPGGGAFGGDVALTGCGDSVESTATFLESLTLCVMEVLAGVRDLDQVARWVSDDVYRHLTQRVVLSARARQVKGDRTIRPTFTIGRTVQSEPAPGVVEGVVIVHGKARSRAVALRLERLNSRWRASAINVL